LSFDSAKDHTFWDATSFIKVNARPATIGMKMSWNMPDPNIGGFYHLEETPEIAPQKVLSAPKASPAPMI